MSLAPSDGMSPQHLHAPASASLAVNFGNWCSACVMISRAPVGALDLFSTRPGSMSDEGLDGSLWVAELAGRCHCWT